MEISDYEYQELRHKAAKYDDEYAHAKRVAKWVAIGIGVVFFAIVGLVYFDGLVGPKLNLYRSNTEKQAVIKEQEAISEAEVFAAEKRVIAARAEAEARLIEAQAIADAQELIASTLTPEYLTWRYYEVLATTENDVVYIPTEAGLPITEARERVAREFSHGEDDQ